MVEYSDLHCSAVADSGGASCKEQSAHGPSGPYPRANSSCSNGDAARTVNAWREQWRQLALQAWSAESDSRRETQNPRSLSQEQLEELRSTLRKEDDDFKVSEQHLWSGLAKVRKRIQVLARNIHFAPQQGDIRRMVQAAEHDLRIFAEQTRQSEDELAALECSLQDTLESSLARFEGWCSQESSTRRPLTPSKPSRPPSCSRLRQADKGSNKEQKELDSMHEQLDKLTADIIADGGSTGGWSFEDHEAFLRVFQKFKRKTGIEFIAEAQQLLPDRPHEDMIAHISWLLRHEDRELQKRHLVEKWRCMRAVAASKEVEPKQELTAAAAQEEKRQRACSRERVQKELCESRHRVAEWRRERNEVKRTQQDQQSRRSEEAREREARDRRHQVDKRRRSLESMQEQRVADDALMGRPASRGARNSTPLSTGIARHVGLEDKRRIAERTAALLQKRASQLQAKRSEPDEQHFEPPLRASSVGTRYKHVESRLEEHTKAHVEQSREFREDQSVSGQNSSKYGVVPGNFAHQGVVRTMRSSAAWRPHFGA